MKLFRPRTSAWLTLLVICLPFAGLLAFIPTEADDVPSTVLLVVGVIALVAYNATVRLIIDANQIRLQRYGLTVWQTPTEGTDLIEGCHPNVSFIPAYVLCRGDKVVGYILKSWFTPAAIEDLRASLRSR